MEGPTPRPILERRPTEDGRSPALGAVVIYLLLLLLGTPLLAAGMVALGTRIWTQLGDSGANVVNAGAWFLLTAYIVWVLLSAFYYAKRTGLRLLVVVVVLLAVVIFVTYPTGHSYTVRAKVMEAINFSNPHRTALGIACSDETLVPSIDHATLGLAPANRYLGKFTRSITASVDTEGRSTVTVVLQAIPGDGWPVPKRAISAGETIVYQGTCSVGVMTWTVHGTAPEKYWPKS